jgi:Flp pilus assembly protein protease CpaA
MIEDFGLYLDFGKIFSAENIFLMSIAVFWMIVASIQDFRKREVENWWTFSLIVFGLAFRAFLSLEKGDYWYFAWGLIGLAGGFIAANIFYYARMFAGGDAKLLMALGVILPLSLDWIVNVQLIIFFLILFLFAGAIYGFVYSFVLTVIYFKNFKKEVVSQFKKYRLLIIGVEVLALVFIFIFYFFENIIGFILSFILLLTPFLLIYAKAIEECCMIKLVNVKELTLGDWLYKAVKVGKRVIRPNWEGLNEKELALIQKNYKKKIFVKQGLPFIPAFLIAFIILIFIIYFFNG